MVLVYGVGLLAVGGFSWLIWIVMMPTADCVSLFISVFIGVFLCSFFLVVVVCLLLVDLVFSLVWCFLLSCCLRV